MLVSIVQNNRSILVCYQLPPITEITSVYWEWQQGHISFEILNNRNLNKRSVKCSIEIKVWRSRFFWWTSKNGNRCFTASKWNVSAECTLRKICQLTMTINNGYCNQSIWKECFLLFVNIMGNFYKSKVSMFPDFIYFVFFHPISPLFKFRGSWLKIKIMGLNNSFFRKSEKFFKALRK